VALADSLQGFERGYAHFSAEFCRKRTLIGVIDGKSNTFLQSSCEYLVVFQLNRYGLGVSA
jgi:hypothetical protein